MRMPCQVFWKSGSCLWESFGIIFRVEWEKEKGGRKCSEIPFLFLFRVLIWITTWISIKTVFLIKSCLHTMSKILHIYSVHKLRRIASVRETSRKFVHVRLPHVTCVGCNIWIGCCVQNAGLTSTIGIPGKIQVSTVWSKPIHARFLCMHTILKLLYMACGFCKPHAGRKDKVRWW